MTPRSASRRRGREVVLRILYQSELTGDPLPDVIEQALTELDVDDPGRAFVRALAEAAAARWDEIDAMLEAVSDNWRLARMGSVDRNVLRMAVAELLVFDSTDARVVLDEAVSIADRFGTDDSGRFVNGLLDRVARRIRAAEFQER